MRLVYTEEQYDLLQSFSGGRLVQELSQEELYVYEFLISERLLQPRADIKDGWHVLSERGKMILENHHNQLREKAENKAAEKKEKVKERIFQTFLVALGYGLGLLTGNIGAILDFFRALFQ